MTEKERKTSNSGALQQVNDSTIGPRLVQLKARILHLSYWLRGLGIDANKPRRKLKFEGVNTDVILEIFRHYVASQTDGVFILLLVSTAWRALVLQSPILWQWVTIDERSPDWVDKYMLCSVLSGNYPLQIILRLPMTEWTRLIPLLHKCQNMFMEIPDYMSGRDVSESTRGLLQDVGLPQSCEVHWCRAGAELLKESREPLSIDLSDLRELELSADGSEHPNYHRYAQTRDLGDLERGDEYHPLLLLKNFHLLEVLRNAATLHSLVLSHHSMDPISSDIDLPTVNLLELHELHIFDIDVERNGSILPLLESLKCPDLLSIILMGECMDVLEVTRHLGTIGRPTHLNLRLKGKKRTTAKQDAWFSLPSIASLTVYIGGITLDNQGTLGVSDSIADLANGLPGLATVRLILSDGAVDPAGALQMLTPARWRDLHVGKIEHESKDQSVVLFEYTKSPHPAVLVIRGGIEFIQEFLRINGNMGVLSASSLRLPEDEIFPERMDPLRFTGLYLSDQDLENTGKMFEAVSAFMENVDGRTIAHIRLPSVALYRKLVIPVGSLDSLMSLYIDGGGEAGRAANHSFLVKKSGSSTLSFNGIQSVLFTRFRDDIGLPLSQTFDIHGTLGERGAHVTFSSNSTLSFQINESDIPDPGSAHYLAESINRCLERFKSITSVRFVFPESWVKGGRSERITCEHISHHLTAQKECTWASSYAFISLPQATTIRKLEIVMPTQSGACGLFVGNMASLTTLICTPHTLLSLLSRHSTPHLQSIYLRYPSTWQRLQSIITQLVYFDEQVTLWMCEHVQALPSLHTLGLSWFPAWGKFREMISVVVRVTANRQQLSIELPSLPHPTLCEAIALALGGNAVDNVTHEAPSKPSDTYKEVIRNFFGASEPAKSTCYYCLCAQVSCRMDHTTRDLHCSRHSLTKLVPTTNRN